MNLFVFFFFQAEDGIRDFHVTGVQTCALPICSKRPRCEACSLYVECAAEGAVPPQMDLFQPPASGQGKLASRISKRFFPPGSWATTESPTRLPIRVRASGAMTEI